MGATTAAEGECDLAELTTVDGLVKTDGKSDGKNVYGCYVHGLFDSSEVLQALSDTLLARKGLTRSGTAEINLREYKEKQYDLLADALRQALDMEQIYRILDEGVSE